MSKALESGGITKETLVQNIDSKALTSELKATIIEILENYSATITKTNEENHIDDPQIYLKLANSYSLSNNWIEAAKYYSSYLKIYPADWEVYFLRGVAYVNSRKDEETNRSALLSYDFSIAYMPVDIQPNVKARLYAYRGAVAKRLNRLDEAESFLLLANKFANADYEIYDIKYNLAAVYAMQGKRKNMIEYISDLVGRPEMANVKAHLKDYFSKYNNDNEFRELIRM